MSCVDTSIACCRKIGDGSSRLSINVCIGTVGAPLHLLHGLLGQLAALLVGYAASRGRQVLCGL